MNCHQLAKKDSPLLQPIRDSAASQQPMEWVRVHELADYVYFNHASHVHARRRVRRVSRPDRPDGGRAPGEAAQHGLVPRMSPESRPASPPARSGDQHAVGAVGRAGRAVRAMDLRASHSTADRLLGVPPVTDYWRSLGEREGTPEFEAVRHREFLEGRRTPRTASAGAPCSASWARRSRSRVSPRVGGRSRRSSRTCKRRRTCCPAFRCATRPPCRFAATRSVSSSRATTGGRRRSRATSCTPRPRARRTSGPRMRSTTSMTPTARGSCSRPARRRPGRTSSPPGRRSTRPTSPTVASGSRSSPSRRPRRPRPVSSTS